MRRAEVRWRFLIAASVVPALFAGFLWLLRAVLPEPWFAYQWPVSYVLSPARYPAFFLSLLLASALLLLYLYLQTGLSRERYLNEALTIANEQRVSSEQMTNQPPQSAPSLASDDHATPSTAADIERLRGEIAIEAATLALAQLQARTPHFWQLVGHVDQRTTGTLARLNGAIRNLGWRGNVNLLVGVAVTALGVGTLAYFVAHQPASTRSDAYLTILSYYVPRVAIIVVLEVFAYFFLKLYRGALEDEKYYNNEMTNVEVQARSLIVAVLRDDSEAIRSVVRTMSAVDRNPVRPSTSAKGIDEIADTLLKLAKELRSGGGKEA